MIGETEMKKFCSLLLVLCLIFSLSACGGNETVTDNDTGSFCTECGEEISATDKFCSSCGASIDKSSTTTKPSNPTHTHSYSGATCTTPAKCSCGATNGSALGHSYSNGVCSRCGGKDSSYVKTYSVGETWVVDGQWEFTIHSAKKHYMCNSYSDHNDMAQCVIITYSYKNLGYTGISQDLYISSMSFDVYDAEGEAAETYPCTHTKSAKVCGVGTKCSNAQEAYALYNNSSQLTLIFADYTSNGLGKQKATFVIPVS